MDAETRTIVRAGLDASAYVAGAAQVEAANAKIAQTAEQVVRTVEKSEAVTRTSGGAMERLAQQLDGAYRAQQQFERAQRIIQSNLERGNVTTQRASELTALAQQRFLGGAQAMQGFAGANDNASRGMGRFSQVMGQAGFQIQDFAVQVQSGTSWLTAMSQQGSQLLGVFGTGGAIAGAVLVVTTLAYSLLRAKDATEELKKAQEQLATAVRAANELLETQAERAARLEREQRANAVQGLTAIFERQAGVVAAERRALELLQRDMQQAAEANRNIPGFNAESVFAQRLEERRRAVAAAEYQLLELNRQIEAARTNPSGAERDRQRQEEERQRQEAEREAERLRREGERAANDQERQAARTAQEREREAERARREAEQQAERTRREAEREAEQNARRLDRQVERWGDSLSDVTFRALEEGAGRGMGVLASLAAGFGSLLRRAAAEAVSMTMFQPLVRSAFGAIGFTGAESGAGSMLGSLGSLFSAGGGISNLLGFSPMEALGLSGGVSGLLASPLLGGGALAGATNSALGAMGGMFGPALPSSLGMAGMSFGQLLGPAALGALGGGLLAQFTGGNQMGGSIGGGLGAAGGALIGSIVPGIGTALGALIGGAAGGGLGGLFGGSGQGFSGGDALIGRTNEGQLTVTGYAGKNFADSAQLLAAAQEQVATLNARLDAAGVFFATGMRANVGGGGSPNPTTVGGALNQFGFGLGSNDPRIAAAIAPFGGNIEGALAIAEEAQAVITALDALKAPADSFAASMKALDDQFRPLWESTVKLGFGADDLNRAWTKAQQDLTAARDRSFLGVTEGIRARELRASGQDIAAQLVEYNFRAVDEIATLRKQLEGLGFDAGITAQTIADLRRVQEMERASLTRGLGQDINDYLARLRSTPAGGFGLTQQLANARLTFDATLASAKLNDADALGRITGEADTLLSAGRGVYASSREFRLLRDYLMAELGGLPAAQMAAQATPVALDLGSLTALQAASDNTGAMAANLAEAIEILRDIAESAARGALSIPPTPVGNRG
jgi:hypothetical protein